MKILQRSKNKFKKEIKIAIYFVYKFNSNRDIHIVPNIEYELKIAKQISDIEKINFFREQGTLNNLINLFKTGELIYLGFYEDKCIHHSAIFINNTNRKIKKEYITIPPQCSWIHYCNTSEKYRGKSIYSSTIREIALEIMKKNNLKAIFIDTDNKNMPSQKGILKAGFDIIGKIYVFKFFKIKIIIRR
ncbi:hypothetical protein KAU32_12325 [bacterium]|nr:hypothetical protein [bacterium]